jgi:hypothetical protein
MKKIMMAVVLLVLAGCALNPRNERQDQWNSSVLRGRVMALFPVGALQAQRPELWEQYKEMVPTTQAKPGDVMFRFSTYEGGILTASDIFKPYTERQFVLITKESLTDKNIGDTRGGDIVDVQFPTWDPNTRTRSSDLVISKVVCRGSDEICMKKHAKCLGPVNPNTDSACH